MLKSGAERSSLGVSLRGADTAAVVDVGLYFLRPKI